MICVPPLGETMAGVVAFSVEPSAAASVSAGVEGGGEVGGGADLPQARATASTPVAVHTTEFQGEIAKRAYGLISSVGQFGMSIRYETLLDLLGVSWSELNEQVFAPAYGVLISVESSGHSRHNVGFRISVRHPVIGSVVFDTVAPDDDAKLKVFQSILARSDPGTR